MRLVIRLKEVEVPFSYKKAITSIAFLYLQTTGGILDTLTKEYIANSSKYYELIENTIVKLNHLAPEGAADVYVKLEAFNPDHLLKTGFSMIEKAVPAWFLLIVEATSEIQELVCHGSGLKGESLSSCLKPCVERRKIIRCGAELLS